MKRNTLAFLPVSLLLALASSCGGGSGGSQPGWGGGGVAVGPPFPEIVDETGVPPSSTASRIAFVDVNLVSMSDQSIMPEQTVIVEDGIVTTIGDTNDVPIPGVADAIDGTGRYLMPGLADMHVHPITGDDSESDLLLQLAAGVTTIRIMWGGTGHLDWKARIEAGDLLGPRLYIASPGLEGDPPFWPGSVVVTTDAEARAAVQEQAAAGFDFIKVYNQLQLEPYEAIIDEARTLDMPVVGHVPGALTADFAITAGQHTIEHFS